jgi:hypothetical protein
MEARSCAGSGETGAGISPFPDPSHNSCHGWSEPPNPWLSHFFPNARFQFRRPFASHVAAPTDRTAGEGLEPTHF